MKASAEEHRMREARMQVPQRCGAAWCGGQQRSSRATHGTARDVQNCRQQSRCVSALAVRLRVAAEKGWGGRE